MTGSICKREDHSYIFQRSSNTINSGVAVGSQTGIKYPYASWSDAWLVVICNVMEFYPKRDSILKTCNVSALDICENYLHWICHTF